MTSAKPPLMQGPFILWWDYLRPTSRRRDSCSSGATSGKGGPDQPTRRFSADVLPRLATSSKLTLAPSFKVLSPAFSTAEM